MKAQADLFSDEAFAVSAEASGTTGIALRLGGKDARLSPAQQRFNRLLARIDKLKVRIADVQALADAHRPLFHATLTRCARVSRTCCAAWCCGWTSGSTARTCAPRKSASPPTFFADFARP